MKHLTDATTRGRVRYRRRLARRTAMTTAAPACPLDVQLAGIHTAMPDLAPRSKS